MKVSTVDWRGAVIEVPLADFLAPQYTSERGALEDAEGLARLNSKVLGAIMARMVERDLMTFEEAKSVAEIYTSRAELVP